MSLHNDLRNFTSEHLVFVFLFLDTLCLRLYHSLKTVQGIRGQTVICGKDAAHKAFWMAYQWKIILDILVV